jgi:small-conductance mechanosensitive channel
MDILKSREQKGDDKPEAQHAHKVFISGYVFLSLAFLIAYLLLNKGVIDAFGDRQEMAEKIALGGFLAFVVLTISRVVEMVVTRKSTMPFARYNLVRAIRLLAFIVIIMVGVTIVFENWYTAAVSLGLISLILGFALQTPISSLIAWLYIIVRTPYHIGDRIQIESFKGMLSKSVISTRLFGNSVATT